MSRRWCNFPGCDVQLHSRNYSGLCRLHTHTQNLCECARCNGQSAKRRPISERPDVRQIFVPTTGNVRSGDDRRVAVSLKAEPWI